MKELIAYINSTVNNNFNNMSSTFPMIPASMGVGFANGYVAVPKDHPFFGKGYDDVNENGYKWVSKCLATGQGTLPDVFEHSEVPGLGSWIIGTREEKLTEEELKEVIPPEVEMALISLCHDGAIESYNSIKESEAGIVLKEIKSYTKSVQII